MAYPKLPDDQVIMYQTADGSVNVQVLYENENLWLPQRRMTELFGCAPENILYHLKNIYSEHELDEGSTAKDFLVVQTEGAREIPRIVKCYLSEKNDI